MIIKYKNEIIIRKILIIIIILYKYDIIITIILKQDHRPINKYVLPYKFCSLTFLVISNLVLQICPLSLEIWFSTSILKHLLMSGKILEISPNNLEHHQLNINIRNPWAFGASKTNV